GGDSERNHVRALLEIEPVDHHRRQPDVVEAAAHQLAERAARSFDEGARHRRARRRPRRLLDLGTDRLLHAPVAARRDAGKHPLQHRARQRITIAEVLVRPQPYLRAAVGAARPWPLDRDAATAECHLAALMAVPYSSALPVVLPFRPDDLVDFFLHQLGEHAEPDTDAQREQPFLGRADQLAERFLHPRRKAQLLTSDLPQRYRLHGGSSSCRLTTSASPRSRSDRTRWRTAASRFYDERDNLRRLGHGEEAELVEHLGELRTRLVICLTGFTGTFAVAYAFHARLIHWLNAPLPLEHRRPVTLGVAEPFTTSLKVSAAAGLALALPIVLWQLWAYLAPAFLPHVQRAIAAAVAVATVLFAAGIGFGYRVALPAAVHFLTNYDSSIYNIQVRANSYYSFALMVLISVGVVFELPVFILTLVRLGILTSRKL